jgi:hypothetical protein
MFQSQIADLLSRIIAYVYCWIIARALRKLPSANPRGTRNSKPRGTRNSKSAQSTSQSSASIAASRFNRRDISSFTPHLNQGPTSPGDGSSRAGIQHQQPQSKKRKNDAEHTGVAGRRTLLRFGKQSVYSGLLKCDRLFSDASHSSPQRSSDDNKARCNFPNVPYQYDRIGGAGAGFITRGLPLTAEDLGDNQQSLDIGEDNDSVIGPMNEDQAPQATSQALVKLAQSKHSTLLFLDLD